MTFHRFTIIRLSRNLLALLISLQVVACGSSTVDSVNLEEGSGGIEDLVATLNWIAPSEREDGTPIDLAEIAGYRVYYRVYDSSSPGGPIAGDYPIKIDVIAGEYPNQIDIMDGTADQANLSDLSPGRYNFVVTTIDTDMRESRFSEEISISIE